MNILYDIIRITRYHVPHHIQHHLTADVDRVDHVDRGLDATLKTTLYNNASRPSGPSGPSLKSSSWCSDVAMGDHLTSLNLDSTVIC